MTTVSTVLVIVIIAVIAVGAYYFFVMPTSPTAVPATTPAGTMDNGTTGSAAPFMAAPIVLVASSSANPALGPFLVAQDSMTLYHFTSDSSTTSKCTGMCATLWPPYLVSSSAQLSAPPDATGALGTIMRPDGSLQVTYNGMPLYFWHSDVNPGDTLGQNVQGVWFVVHP